ncbi:MAG: hypothetical protein R8G01_13425 [Ilumatobacteraceae bacterium]|nr:hypothetical protein [Ilumatobacteraceae bacterium]
MLIAHSHGGNVAQQALTRVAESGERTRLITIGTPFLGYRDLRHIEDIHRRPLLSWGRISWLTFSAAMGLALAYGLLTLDRKPGPDPEDFATWVPLDGFTKTVALLTASFALGAAALVAVMIGVTVVSLAVVRLQPADILPTLRPARPRRTRSSERASEREAPSTDPRTTPPAQARGDGMLRAGHLDETALPEITMIRTKGDEAAALLRFGTRLSSLVDRTRWAADRLPTLVALPTFMIGLAVVTAMSIAGPDVNGLALVGWVALSGFPSSEVVALVAALAAIPATVGIAASALALLEAVTCGFDGIPLLTRGRVSMYAEPDRVAAVHEVELGPRSGRSLRHSRLLSDENSIDVITRSCDRMFRSLGLPNAAPSWPPPPPPE